MRIAITMRKPFDALEEALRSVGSALVQDVSDSDLDALIVDFCDAARHPFDSWALRRRMPRGKPLVAIARDAPWHKGVRHHKLAVLDFAGIVDIYATHSLQDASRHGRQVLYFPSAARLSQYGLAGVTLADLRDPARYRHAVSFIGNLDASRYP